MLEKFRLKNYKAFRDDTFFLLANYGTISKKAFPFAAIVGANASGKSTVVEAFRAMQDYVLHSVYYGGDPRGQRISSALRKNMPFLLDEESKQAPTLFEIEFTQNAYDYTYGFTLNAAGLCQEWLTVKSEKGLKASFFRSVPDNKIDFRKFDITERKILKSALNPGTLVVSLGAMLNIEDLKTVRDWFHAIYFATPSTVLLDEKKIQTICSEMKKDPAYVQDLVAFLTLVDPSIKGFRLEEDPAGCSMYSVHQMEGQTRKELPIAMESTGMKMLIGLFPIIQSWLEHGGVLVVDEINAMVQPLLLRRLLRLFAKPTVNRRKAQLIITAHNLGQLPMDIVGQDGIWMIKKKRKDGTARLSPFKQEKIGHKKKITE